MARRQRVEFWFTGQVGRFGFLPQGLATSPPVPPISGQRGELAFFSFTQPYVRFKSIGQAGGTSPPVGGAFQYLIHGPDVTEQFVTGGGISAMGVSYPFNPLSRRTV